MKDWLEKLDAFLQFNGQEILENAGSISKKIGDTLAESTYESIMQIASQNQAIRPQILMKQ